MQAAAEILSVTDHRRWELPSGAWIMQQRWSNLLFAHWQVPQQELRPLVPDRLKLDTFEEEAYLSITPFQLKIKLRGQPSLPQFPELNCRTYVSFGGKPGIFFFSLDAGRRLAVWAARAFYFLPYFDAVMSARQDGSAVQYSSHRKLGPAVFRARYQPHGPVRFARRGTLEDFLAERYCLYAERDRQLYRGEIHHAPWPLQNAICEISENSVAAAAGIHISGPPSLIGFARELDVLIWPITPVP